MSSEAKCPKCGSGPLRVVVVTVEFSDPPILCDDGFDFYGLGGDTSDEAVRCDACGEQFPLADVPSFGADQDEVEASVRKCPACGLPVAHCICVMVEDHQL